MNGVIGTETAARGLWQSEKKSDVRTGNLKQDFAAALNKAQQKRWTERAKRLKQKADLDGDGKISPEEWLQQERLRILEQLGKGQKNAATKRGDAVKRRPVDDRETVYRQLGDGSVLFVTTEGGRITEQTVKKPQLVAVEDSNVPRNGSDAGERIPLKWVVQPNLLDFP